MDVYVNGEFMDECRSQVNALDRGLLLGEGLFETMRAYNGTIFMLERHLARIFKGADVLGFKGMPEHDVLSRACRSTLVSNGFKEARLRLTITRGTLTARRPTVIVNADRYRGYESILYETGMTAMTLSGYRISGSPMHAIKSTSYLPSLVARQAALSAGYHEAVLINDKGYVAEGSFTNIFAVKAGAVITPPASDGLLPGIARECVLELAREADLRVVEESIPEGTLESMDELFLTNSLLEVMPLTKVNGANVGDGKPGAVALGLLARYKQRVAAEI